MNENLRTIRCIIAGSRSFGDYGLLKSRCDRIFSNTSLSDLEIVSGTANGADKLGERYAQERNIPIKLMPADWSNHGKRAGPMRNQAMAKYATHAVVFWDGRSRGTKNMIELADAKGLNYRIIYYLHPSQLPHH
ncbi:MAG: DUF2493 domain-containing protein [Cyanobacteria bacterium P01_E01_bin.6]